MSNEALTFVAKLNIRPSGRKFVAMALADYADENWSCFPSVAQLAQYTSQGEKTVRDHLAALEEDGFLTRVRRRNEDGTLGRYRFIVQRQISPVAKIARGEKPPEPAANFAGHNPHKNHQSSSLRSEECAPERTSSPVERAFEVFSEVAGMCSIPVPRSLTADRRRKIEARLREHGENVWREACQKLAASPFCNGKNDRGWIADLDFLCQPKSFNRLIEGGYDDRPAPQARGLPPQPKTMTQVIDERLKRYEQARESEYSHTIDADLPADGDDSDTSAVYRLAAAARH